VFGTNHLARKLLLVALCNLTFALGCDSRLYDPPKTPFFKTAISGALSSGDIIQLEGQFDGTIRASYIDMHDNEITVSQLVSVNDRVFAWVQYDTTVPSPVPAPKGIYELSLSDYSLTRLPIDLPGSSPAQQTGLLSVGGRLFAATGDGLWELLEDENGVWSSSSVLNEKFHMRLGEVYTDNSRICLRSADQRTCIVIDVEDFSRIEIPMDQKERIFGIATGAVFIGQLAKSTFRAVAISNISPTDGDRAQKQLVQRDKVLQVLQKTSWGLSHIQTIGPDRVLVQVHEEFPQLRMWYIDPFAGESMFVEGFYTDDLVILE
jgi:hypothetical protein